MNILRQTFRVQILIIILFTTTIASFAQTNPKQIKTISGKPIEVSQLNGQIKMIMDSIGMPGLSLAIINDSEIVYQNVFGVSSTKTKAAVTEQSIFEAASLSKPLFAYFVMKQVEKGILDLDRPLYKYLPFPEIEKDERSKSITARMVLSHKSGLPNWRHLDNEEGELKLKCAPGSEFIYSGEGYQYLAEVIANINGTDHNGLDEIFKKEVTEQLRPRAMYYMLNDRIKKHKVYGHNENGPTDNEQYDGTRFGAAYSLHTEAVSYAKFIVAMLKREGLSESSFDDMLKEQVHFKDDNPLKLQTGQTGWGLGFAQRITPNGTIHLHTGNNHDFQAYAMFMPKINYGIVFMTNSDKSIPFIMKIGNLIEKQF
jgi:CubicO group peptidase (beta-lactamase class C family)